MTPAQKACWDAARRIERYGWIRGSYGNYRKGYCVLGALRAGSLVPFPELHDFLQLSAFESLVAWNDAPDRTAEEVIDMLVIASMWEDE